MRILSSLIIFYSINVFSAAVVSNPGQVGFIPNYQGDDLKIIVNKLNKEHKQSLKLDDENENDDDKSSEDKERDDKFASSFCSLLTPGQKDTSSNECSIEGDKRSYFGYVYDGFLVNNRCYESAGEAKWAAVETNACFYQPPARSGFCELNRPSHQDRVGRYCLNNKYYSVTFDGFILNRECTQEIDQSLDKAIDSFICGIEPPVKSGTCEIMNPSQFDRAGLRCQDPHSYAITRNGFIVDSVCFVTIEQAYAHMNRTYSCRR